MSYKSENTLSQRMTESQRVLRKYNNRIPIILSMSSSCKDLLMIDKTKFIVPETLTAGQFISIIRKRLHLLPEKAIFIFVNNTVPQHSMTMKHIYTEHKDEDGFLYITYSAESTFG